MKRLKILLALVVPALSLVALTGPAAQASRLVSPKSEGTTWLAAVPTSSQRFFTGEEGGEIGCTGSSLEGEMAGVGQAQFTTSVSKDFKCSFFGEKTMKMNGCKFTFHPGAEKSPGVLEGTFDIGPSTCGPLAITWVGGCEVDFYPKTGLTAEFSNVGEGEKAAVSVKMQATGLKTNGGSCSSLKEVGTYTGSWELKGYQNAARTSQIGIHVTSKAALYIGGEPRVFKGEAYPEILAGTSTNTHKFSTSEGGVECKHMSYSTFSDILGEASSEMGGAPKYSECNAYGFTATVTTSGCEYLLSVTNSGPPYVGKANLVCGSGSAIVVQPLFLGYPVCTQWFTPQSLGTVTYENVGSGVERHVVAVISGSGIEYHGTGGVCGESGAMNKDGKFAGGIEIQGTM